EPVQPVAPPPLPVQVVADQVPAAAEQDETMRFYVPAGLLAAGRGVREPDPFGIPAGEGHGGEDLRVYGLPGRAAHALPAGRYRRACSRDSGRNVRTLVLAMFLSSLNSGQEPAAISRSVRSDR